MNIGNAKVYLAALLATAIALKADIGTPDLPDSVEGYVSWALTGVIAGVGALVGPEVAQGIKNALLGKENAP